MLIASGPGKKSSGMDRFHSLTAPTGVTTSRVVGSISYGRPASNVMRSRSFMRTNAVLASLRVPSVGEKRTSPAFLNALAVPVEAWSA